MTANPNTNGGGLVMDWKKAMRPALYCTAGASIAEAHKAAREEELELEDC